MLKRPCLLLACACFLGEMLVLPDFPGILRISLFLFYLSYLFVKYYQNKITSFFFLLLLLCSIFSAFHFRSVSEKLSLYHENMNIFGKNLVSAEGVVSAWSYGDEKTQIILKHANLSNGYGSLSELPEDAPMALRSRYHRPVGSIKVYMDGEVTLYPGQKVKILGKLMPGELPTNEGEFSFLLYSRSLGQSGSMSGTKVQKVWGSGSPYFTMVQKLRRKVQDWIYAVADADYGVFIAILLGNKQEMDKELQSLYQKNGISHILAVSGLHLSVIGAGFYELLRMLGLSYLTAGIFGGILVLSYGFLAGASGSAMRAVIMLLLRFLSKACGRSYDMLSALSFAFILLIWNNPMILYHSGFQLSFMAVFSLSLLGEMTLPEHPILRTFVSSLFLQLFLLPLTLFHYFTLPVYGIFLNLLVLPLFSFVIYAGIGALGLYMLYEVLSMRALFMLSEKLMGGGRVILSFYTYLCKKTEGLPGAYVVLGRPKIYNIFFYYLALLLLCNLWIHLYERSSKIMEESCEKKEDQDHKSATYEGEKKRKRCTLILSVSIISAFVFSLIHLPPSEPKKLEITALDVGQGDGFIIRYQGRVISVDGGSSSDRKLGENILTPYLKSQGISCIDLSIISHCDSDHTSGIIYLLEEGEIKIGELLLPGVAVSDHRYDKLRELAAGTGTEVRYLKAGDQVDISDLYLKCYFPLDIFPMEDANSHSSGILLQYHEFYMLFTGDMPKEMEIPMLKAMEDAGGIPDIDILKAGHHGSHTSTSEELLMLCKPEYGILSYGRNNSYGHPHMETMEIFDKYQIQEVSTGELGEIRITSDGESYRIFCPLSFSRENTFMGQG